ncbi:unnamed protein product [Peniophora sp. CBMAI 1063]|nr:unnamed protein product [Peniophora sp. CBMAI 1063]
MRFTRKNSSQTLGTSALSSTALAVREDSTGRSRPQVRKNSSSSFRPDARLGEPTHLPATLEPALRYPVSFLHVVSTGYTSTEDRSFSDEVQALKRAVAHNSLISLTTCEGDIDDLEEEYCTTGVPRSCLLLLTSTRTTSHTTCLDVAQEFLDSAWADF